MIIQHNIPALNAHRQYSINNSNLSGNLEKLSSGYRINRAADDAAGLAISEKMRGQIRGLAQAEMNVEHGINLIQTAEGGLQEVHDILQRMRELAVQSANGTYEDENDRYNLNKELEALKEEIDRISESTHYNNIQLLNGNLGVEEYVTAKSTSITFDDTVGWTDMDPITDTDVSFGTGPTVSGSYEINLTFDDDGLLASAEVIIDGTAYAATIGYDATTGELELSYTDAVGAETITIASIKQDQSASAAFETQFNADDYENFTGTVLTISFDYDISTTSIDASSFDVSQVVNYDDIVGGGLGLTFQIGANGDKDQRTTLHVENMSTLYIGSWARDEDDGYRYLTENGLDYDKSIRSISVALQDDANAAIDIIDDAINYVSATRADLGAMQNRLEHALSSLGVMKENLTDAESTIRDVDMAAEMMEYTKNSILVQSAQAMLAQAQTLPQGVLNLLS